MMTTIHATQFDRIAKLAYAKWGLHLTDKKVELVENRLAKHLRRHRIADLDGYLHRLETEATEPELLTFFDLLSTNTTSFFRERGAFDYLEREFYTPLVRGNLTRPNRRIRIWSAACSNGAEPYSLAMHAREHLPEIDQWDFKILATDLADSVLHTARQAVYPAEMTRDLDRECLKRHFLRGTGAQCEHVTIKPEVKRLVTVGRLNLMDEWPLKGPFDIIFCRNVMIYFDQPTRARLVARLHGMLRPGGIFAIGSAETLSGLNVPFRNVQPSVYTT